MAIDFVPCRICARGTTPIGEATILQKHRVRFDRCDACGFVQTEEPYWLQEAYSTAITRSDVGLVYRNLLLARASESVIRSFYDPSGRFVDFGGGYGLFVRLMRDRGFDFYLDEKRCENLFAAGFETPPAVRCELTTALEVIEHLVNPFETVAELLERSADLLFTTECVADPPPRPGDWWYYGLEHGQHISFFTYASLRKLAERMGRRFVTDGVSLHLFTTKAISDRAFRRATSPRVTAFRWLFGGRPSLLIRDYEHITGGTMS